MNEWAWSTGGMILTKIKYAGKKPVPVALCTPQIPLTRDKKFQIKCF
jgi:hypothetical protein